MLVLALDASQIQASVCLWKDGQVLESAQGSVAIAHSEALLPLIDILLRKASISLESLNAFAVGIGPGSFTGIRVGCSTIKGLAQALKKPILPFSSLRALACSSPSSNRSKAAAMINAYQKQVFVGWFEQGQWREEAMTASSWIEAHGQTLSSIEIVGSGVTAYLSELQQSGSHAALNPHLLYATAQGVAGAVSELLLQPDGSRFFVPYMQLKANYMRPSQAELKLKSIT